MTDPIHRDDVPPTLIQTSPVVAASSGRRAVIGGGLVVVAALLLALVPADNKAPIGAVAVPVHQAVAQGPDTSSTPVVPPPLAAPAAAVAPPPPPPAPPVNQAPPAKAAQARAIILADVSPAHARFTIDNRPFRTGRVAVIPGRHVLAASAPGFVTQSDTLRISAGDTLRWKPQLAREIAAAPPTERTPPPAVTPPARSPARTESDCQSSVDRSDWDVAFAACSRAAAAGSIPARRNLGALYQHGHGVRHNDDSAVAWYQLAAQANDAEAMYELGDAYEHGHGVKKDPSAALEWYGRAANRGSAAAQYTLGQVYEKGHLGVAKDRAQALAWYRKAAAQHYKDADDRVHDLSK